MIHQRFIQARVNNPRSTNNHDNRYYEAKRAAHTFESMPPTYVLARVLQNCRDNCCCRGCPCREHTIKAVHFDQALRKSKPSVLEKV